jgi:glycine dehydrogenase subunit 1
MSMQNFLPHTEADRQAMLNTIGVKGIADLFGDIPAQLRNNISYNVLPAQGLSEQELQQTLAALAEENLGQRMACFLGGGAYARYVPMAVNSIAGRAEFYTAYTPYQPEIAQGTLQVTYEFQTMICELTGMDVANASVYDGASAVTEAALMAMRSTKRSKVLVADTVHPDYRAVLKTYLAGLGDVTLVEFNPEQAEAVLDSNDQQAACVILQVPNYLGNLEPTDPVRRFCEATGALFIVSAEPISLGLLKAPGSYGADIVTGDIQPLGNNLSFGGPYGGYIATRSKHMRQLPGRLVGRTVDKTGKKCYTLTLQTREQHIRREKATSNICTNQALNVLKATVYMSLIGPVGMKTLANLSMQRAHFLAEGLQRLPGVALYKPAQPFLFEFAVRFPVPVRPLLRHLETRGILGGIELERFYPDARNVLLVTCTEMTTQEQINLYVSAVESYLKTMRPEDGPPGKPEISGTTEKKMEAAC